ncbi:MAG: precorrin-4 C(11)-methyltransferase [Desulfobacterales bacterium]|nr:MAG: precorrin-4 C(11)-methyltransferase [Desulfobacterales bacterium]
MTRHPVIFTGAGPGAPDLITVRGKNALEQADLVVYAGSLVPRALLTWAPQAEAVNSAPLHLDEIIEWMAAAVEKGKKVVRLHTGDPSLYGAIFEQMAELDKRGMAYEVIPGVTAAVAAAAALGLEYTLPEITQTLILTRVSGRTKVPETEKLASLAAHGASMAIYLSIAQIKEVQAVIETHYGRDFSCAVAVKVSQPEERIYRVPASRLARTVKENGVRSQALIVVSPSLNTAPGGIPCKSKLYDPEFAHECRS